MSIALDRIETLGFGRVMRCACDISSFESPPSTVKERKRLSKAEEEDEDWGCSSSTTTSSSIGRNSDDDDDESGRSSDGGDCDENEVQSYYKGPLDRMDSIEQADIPHRASTDILGYVPRFNVEKAPFSEGSALLRLRRAFYNYVFL
ncbi:Detected protein of unknown function [Hibiscus syriacus]|uniref:Uncharacterized protein n=1 Tax=Hibiscus syriacus TaxID=106335 RepID=A0A6A2X7E6_HIBSY|nr:Detected protein of unknown function [Hibiscus syriacus]